MDRSEYLEVYKIISEEVGKDRAAVRQRYLNEFSGSVTDFIAAMSDATLKWKSLESSIEGNIKKAHISSVIYGVINIHVVSTKMFLSGYSIPAGNLQRQVIEFIALALLCSNKNLDILKRYMNDEYSTNKAIRDLQKNGRKLNLNKKFIETLGEAWDFFHNYSHPTHLTITTFASFSEKGVVYFGASFDEGKFKQYSKQIKWHVDLAHKINDVINTVKLNLEDW